MVAAVVVALPFLDRPVALPVLTCLWRKGGPTNTVLARELIEMIASHTNGHTVHVVANGAYLCTELRRLPPHVTLTRPLRSNASTHPDLDHPPRLRGRGRPRTYAARIGTPADLAATTPSTPVTVTRYGRITTVQVHQLRCLWRGVFGARPVRVLVVTEPGKPDLALVTTDLTTSVTEIVERHAGRWCIEVAFEDAKQITGVGEARDRTRKAVERTLPFGLYTQSIVITWYHLAGHHPSVVRDRRHRAPLVRHQKKPVLPGHDRQATASPDRRPISSRCTWPAHAR